MYSLFATTDVSGLIELSSCERLCSDDWSIVFFCALEITTTINNDANDNVKVDITG